jgi:hypothetical protein
MSLLRDVIWELQLPDAMDPGIHGAQNALDPGFHGVPAVPARPEP